jgi:hypothetical protein
MGAKLVLAGLQASAQRVMEERNFVTAWMAHNQGNPSGAYEAFNEKFPAEEYAQQALQKFGMDQDGFSTPQAVAAAAKQGFLTRKQAEEMLNTPRLKKQLQQGG